MLLAVLVVLLVILLVLVLGAGGIDIDITSWRRAAEVAEVGPTEQGMVMGVCVLMSFFLFCNLFF